MLNLSLLPPVEFLKIFCDFKKKMARWFLDQKETSLSSESKTYQK